MKLIFCLSNLFVPATLTIIKQAGGTPVMVFIDQEGILKFFKSLNMENVMIYYRKEPALKKNIYSICCYFKERSDTLKKLEKHNLRELYFFHNTFGESKNWLIMKLSKKVKTFFIPIFNELPFKKKQTITAIKSMLFSRLIYGIKIEPLFTGERYIPKINDSFFIKNNVQNKQLIIDNNYIKCLINEKYDFGNEKIVLLTGSIVELNQVEENEYIQKINALITSIGADKIVAKPHPRFPNRYGMENKLELIPAYIPANVLFASFKIFIGYSSTVLSEAVNEGLIAISLLDYFKSNSLTRCANYKEYLKENSLNDNIVFLTELADLKSILEKQNR